MLKMGTHSRRRHRRLGGAGVIFLCVSLVAACDLPAFGSHVPNHPIMGSLAWPGFTSATSAVPTYCDWDRPVYVAGVKHYYCRNLDGVEENGRGIHYGFPAGSMINSVGDEHYGRIVTRDTGQQYEGCDLTIAGSALWFKCDYLVSNEPRLQFAGGSGYAYFEIFKEWANYTAKHQALCAGAMGSALFGGQQISLAIGRTCGYGPWEGR